ncbi:DENN domain-containing protein 10-like isoform X2 [Gigantopelta aegis]|uniref:DENN domain-containing protein 10-like isoform X2 n=1 Tax=Gigantopelta aegis TaxID=1735272 RepID=UPI001B88D8C3|nr:DENN domain-containing protein 10-like isoform X2 [Gigantopelta aegis]
MGYSRPNMLSWYGKMVTHFSVILTTKDFNPEKYEALSKLLSRQYMKTGNPAHMLEHYLSVITKGTCNNEENGKFSVIDFDSRHAFANSQLKSIIQTHGAETILLYTAMLLKKRIAVYFPRHSIGDLLSFTRSLPALVWHRQNWDVVYPFLSLTENDVSSVKHINHYVVGFTEAEIEGRSDLYDIFVNGPANQITVSSQAKEYFTLGKLHKDISMVMIESAEKPENTDQDVIKDIAKKTKELLTNLKSLASDDGSGNVFITLESLRERKMPPARESFLFNLAACEGLVQL